MNMALATCGPERRESAAAALLAAVFAALDRAGVAWCLPHGEDAIAAGTASDIDIVISPEVRASQLYAVLAAAAPGARVIRNRGLYFVVASPAADAFLHLDFSTCSGVGALVFSDAQRQLESRRRSGAIWVPAPEIAFGASLARWIAKAALDDARAERLAAWYRSAPEPCAREAARLFGAAHAAPILSAARSGDWPGLRPHMARLRRALRRRAIWSDPVGFARRAMTRKAARLTPLLRPAGLSVVLLGPDGAGKSTAADQLQARLRDAFSRSACWGFAPRPLGWLRRRPASTERPHGLKPRSLFASLLRAVYWFVCALFGHVWTRIVLARATLLVSDRHFVDILVDQRRYRYAGPAILLRVIWRVMVKPDLVILLDAPAEVLQSRKQEVPFAETEAQCRRYRRLMRGLANGRIVDAAQPPSKVAAEIADIVLGHMAERVRRVFTA